MVTEDIDEARLETLNFANDLIFSILIIFVIRSHVFL